MGSGCACPSADDEHAFGTPFSIRGRDTKEVIAEFGDNNKWLPKPGASYRIRLEAKVHPKESWDEVLAFTWWAPPKPELMDRYIAHRNQREVAATDALH